MQISSNLVTEDSLFECSYQARIVTPKTPAQDVVIFAACVDLVADMNSAAELRSILDGSVHVPDFPAYFEGHGFAAVLERKGCPPRRHARLSGLHSRRCLDPAAVVGRRCIVAAQ